MRATALLGRSRWNRVRVNENVAALDMVLDGVDGMIVGLNQRT